MLLYALPFLLFASEPQQHSLNSVQLRAQLYSDYVTGYDWTMGFPGGSDGRETACNAGDWGSIPGSGRSPGEGNGNPLQYSCLENPMDGGAWWATVHGVAKSQTRLSHFTSLHSTYKLNKQDDNIQP